MYLWVVIKKQKLMLRVNIYTLNNRAKYRTYDAENIVRSLPDALLSQSSRPTRLSRCSWSTKSILPLLRIPHFTLFKFNDGYFSSQSMYFKVVSIAKYHKVNLNHSQIHISCVTCSNNYKSFRCTCQHM